MPAATLVKTGCARSQPKMASATPRIEPMSCKVMGISAAPIVMLTPLMADFMSIHWPVGVSMMRFSKSAMALPAPAMSPRMPISSSRELDKRMLKTLMPSAPKMSVSVVFFFSSESVESLAFSSPKTSMKSRVLPVAWS